jgi:hypothetical protein
LVLSGESDDDQDETKGGKNKSKGGKKKPKGDQNMMIKLIPTTVVLLCLFWYCQGGQSRMASIVKATG